MQIITKFIIYIFIRWLLLAKRTHFHHTHFCGQVMQLIIIIEKSLNFITVCSFFSCYVCVISHITCVLFTKAYYWYNCHSLNFFSIVCLTFLICLFLFVYLYKYLIFYCCCKFYRKLLSVMCYTNTVCHTNSHSDVSHWGGHFLWDNVSWNLIDHHNVWYSLPIASRVDWRDTDYFCNCWRLDGSSWFHDFVCGVFGYWSYKA